MENMRDESLSDIAYNYILRKIISFDYRPNDPIIENDICEELEISRTPLREALRRLEAEGFVSKVRHRGTFVRPYTQEDIAESCDIRTLFELYSLEHCIRSVDAGKLQAIKSQLLSLSEQSTPEEYYRSDTDLHNMITSYCMNKRMKAILRSLEVQLDVIQKISAQTPNRLNKSKKEHLAIVEAIEQGDLDLSSELLRDHLHNVKESCIQNFQKIRFQQMEQ